MDLFLNVGCLNGNSQTKQKVILNNKDPCIGEVTLLPSMLDNLSAKIAPIICKVGTLRGDHWGRGEPLRMYISLHDDMGSVFG